jgi:ferric-dicitrate binding protein FerR (iron transport regulator)
MNTDTLTACERLAASRERLRLGLQGKAAAAGTAPAPGSTPAWMAPLMANPAAALALQAARAWWSGHPLHALGQGAAAAADAALRPVARRHPIALVLGAGLLGGLLVWSRPWRWLPSPALLATAASLVQVARSSRPGP